jgi:hypothetical protein
MALPTFTYSGVSYAGQPAGTTTFALTTSGGKAISYLLPSHIHVYSTVDNGTTLVELTRPSQWGFNGAGTAVVLTSGIAVGTGIILRRITQGDGPYTTFGQGTLLTADQLNDATLYNLYVVQEQEDVSNAAITQIGASAAAASASASAAAASAASADAEATAAIAAADAATAAATAVTTTANAAASAANAAVQIATAAAVPQSPIQVLEPLGVLVNAAFSIGTPGSIPFGIGPVLSPGKAFTGIAQSDYYPIHVPSGSFC